MSSLSTSDISGLLGSCSVSLVKLVTFEKLSVTSPLNILCLLRPGSQRTFFESPSQARAKFLPGQALANSPGLFPSLDFALAGERV